MLNAFRAHSVMFSQIRSVGRWWGVHNRAGLGIGWDWAPLTHRQYRILVRTFRRLVRSRERSNASGLDDYSTEGNVVEVRCDTSTPAVYDVPEPTHVPYLVIGTRDGHQQLRLIKGAREQCASARVGDYAEADGSKETEQLFDADSLTLTHSGD